MSLIIIIVYLLEVVNFIVVTCNLAADCISKNADKNA